MTERTGTVRVFDAATHADDPRSGALRVIEAGELPFPVDRVFMVSNMSKGAIRGKHANRVVSEVIMCVRGAVRIWMHDGGMEHEMVLDAPQVALYVPPGTWITLEALEDDSAYMVLADKTFSEASQHYIRDFDRFIEERTPR